MDSATPTTGHQRLLGGQGGRRVGAGQLQQLAGDVHVDRAQAPSCCARVRDDRDRHLGQVAQHNGAVVGGREVGILSGLLVGGADGGEADRLRRLPTPQPVAGEDVGDRAVSLSTSTMVSADVMTVLTAS